MGPDPITTESGPWGAFFSGGLDSFRTLQRFGHQLDHLLFVHGFDIPLSDPAKGDLVQAALTQMAAEVGPSLLTVRTNLRAFTDRWVSWERHQCGGALAAVALLLAPRLSRVIIPYRPLVHRRRTERLDPGRSGVAQRGLSGRAGGALGVPQLQPWSCRTRSIPSANALA